MALRIRLTRLGAKKRPFYRIVVIDSRRSRSGEYLDLIGNYDPLKNPAEIRINAEKAVSWMHKGAIPSDTVRQMFSKQSIHPRIQGHNVRNNCALPMHQGIQGQMLGALDNVRDNCALPEE